MNARNGRAIGAPFVGHSEEVYSVTMSVDGSMIVSASRDKTIKIWGANTGNIWTRGCFLF